MVASGNRNGSADRFAPARLATAFIGNALGLNKNGGFDAPGTSGSIGTFITTNTALRDNFLGIGFAPGASPAFARIGVVVEVQPATFLGFWLMRTYETRGRARSGRQVLQRRVEELEQVTAALEAQMQQVLDADRFASALLLKPSGGERKQRVEESPH